MTQSADSTSLLSRPAMLSFLISFTVALTGALGSYYQTTGKLQAQIWETRLTLEHQLREQISESVDRQAENSYPANREYFFDRQRGEELQQEIRQLRAQVAEIREMVIEIRTELGRRNPEDNRP